MPVRYAEVVMETRYEHIALNEDHVPIISDTTMKVVELVVEQQAYGWSPEELHFQHPYLTLGQIHSALAYYWDHSKELNEDIQRRLERVERERVLFTQDDDLLAEAAQRHRQSQTFSGVIYAQQLHVSIGDCIRDLEIIVQAGERED